MNKSLSKSQSQLNFDILKLLQRQFSNWAGTWSTNHDGYIPPTYVDLPDIVTLLQALGYKLRKMDAQRPEDIANLTSASCSSSASATSVEAQAPNQVNDRGVRVVITCAHSGQICVLECPLAKERCRCLKAPEGDGTGETFWEVTAVGGRSRESSLIESGCDTLPTVSKEVNILVANVLNYLCDVIVGNKELGQVETPLNLTPLSSKSGRYSDSATINMYRGTRVDASGNLMDSYGAYGDLKKPPSVSVSSPAQNGSDSPARYRSLDTLTSGNAEKILPEPGTLIAKDPEDIQKSMDLLSVQDQQESSSSTIGDNSFSSASIGKLKQAYKIIGDIIEKADSKKNISTEKEKRKSSSATNIIQKFLRAPKLPTSAAARTNVHNSSPNLPTKVTDQGKPLFAMGGKRGRIGSTTSMTEKALVQTVKKRPVARSNTLATNPTEKSVTASAKKVSKFTNVKSTIPKPDAAKKRGA